MSLLINLGGQLTKKFATEKWSAKTIIMGGDDLMIEAQSSKFNPEEVEEMRKAYKARVKTTLSCGVGSTPEEAMKAIVIAKNTGKNKAVFWEDSMASQYKTVVKKRINELRTKIVAAGGITESGDGLMRTVRNQFQRLIAKRKANNAKLGPTFTGAKKPALPPPLSPIPSVAVTVKHRPAKTATGAAGNSSPNHQKEMVATLRNLIVHHSLHQRNLSRKADALMALGRPDEAKAFRAASKLAHHKLMKDHQVLHHAAQVNDTDLLHHGSRKKLIAIRKSMATRIRQARKGHGEADAISALIQKKVAGRSEGRKKFRLSLPAVAKTNAPDASKLSRAKRKKLKFRNKP